MMLSVLPDFVPGNTGMIQEGMSGSGYNPMLHVRVYHEKGQYHFPYDGQSVLLQAQPVATVSAPVAVVVIGAISDSPAFSHMSSSPPFFRLPVLSVTSFCFNRMRYSWR
jgi:hypothetical protein